MRIVTIILLLLCLTASTNAQEEVNSKTVNTKVSTLTRKGSIFAYWGWNRSFYSNSTITLKGADYSLTLKNVKATDRPTMPINYYNYLRLDRISIPQTNFRIGYFVKDNIAVSVGVDHMKYVMVQNQSVNVEGNINREGAFMGTYSGLTKLTDDFLTFEHTDGLNYINVEVEKHTQLFNNKANWINISYYYGGGLGVLLPKTNVKFLDYERNDRFHLSGFGLSAKGGFSFTFLRHLQLRLEQKFGYINMPDIMLHQQGIEGRGKQHFFFGETIGTIGAVFKI